MRCLLTQPGSPVTKKLILQWNYEKHLLFQGEIILTTGQALRYSTMYLEAKKHDAAYRVGG